MHFFLFIQKIDICFSLKYFSFFLFFFFLLWQKTKVSFYNAKILNNLKEKIQFVKGERFDDQLSDNICKFPVSVSVPIKIMCKNRKKNVLSGLLNTIRFYLLVYN